MATIGEKMEALTAAGYQVATERHPPYRGAPHESDMLIATKNGTRYAVSTGHTAQFENVFQVQSQVPLAAQIVEIVSLPSSAECVAAVEYMDGGLVWELEGAKRPSADDVFQAASKFADQLNNVDLVHADIRPWNIFYTTTQQFRFIDWGFSFKVGGDRFGNTDAHLHACGHANHADREVDRYDARATLYVLRDSANLEKLWNYRPNQFNWYPSPWT